jgi:hypothetical protein
MRPPYQYSFDLTMKFMKMKNERRGGILAINRMEIP